MLGVILIRWKNWLGGIVIFLIASIVIFSISRCDKGESGESGESGGPSKSSEPQGAPVVKIYSEVTYVAEKKGFFGGTSEVRKSVVFAGSGFLYKDVIVTARHVVAGPRLDLIGQLGNLKLGGGNELKRATTRIRISDLSLRPSAVFLSEENDIAYLRLAEDDLKRLGLLRNKEASSVKVGTEVKFWGFPGTVSPQLFESNPGGGSLSTVAVYPDYFVINSPTENGYSGGPVVDQTTNKLLGVAIRSEERQTRALLLKDDPHAETLSPYSEPFQLR